MENSWERITIHLKLLFVYFKSENLTLTAKYPLRYLFCSIFQISNRVHKIVVYLNLIRDYKFGSEIHLQRKSINDKQIQYIILFFSFSENGPWTSPAGEHPIP